MDTLICSSFILCIVIVCRYSSVVSSDPPATAPVVGDVKLPSSKVSLFNYSHIYLSCRGSYLKTFIGSINLIFIFDKNCKFLQIYFIVVTVPYVCSLVISWKIKMIKI